MSFTPAQIAALSSGRGLAFAAIDVFAPGRTLRLLVNSGFVAFNGHTYTSRDEIFGVFSDIDALTDGVGNEAPSVLVTLIPPSIEQAGQVAAVELQGSPVKIWLGVMDPVTGQSIDAPALLLDGLLDTAAIRIDENGNLKVDYEIGSVFDEFFLANDMARLSDGFHQYLWPGELGCSYVTWVTHQLYWGTESPDGVTI